MSTDMSEDRHSSIIPVLPHRTAPPMEEEIFGARRPVSEMELGLLQMQILWLLNRRSTHGYDIMATLNKIKTTKITQGTLYPTLQRLEELKLVKPEVQDRRKIYHVTAEGRKTMNEVCLDFTHTFFGIFKDFVCNKCLDHNHEHGEKR